MQGMDELGAARAGDQSAFARLIAPHRRELRAHCYRMSGSLHDADDLLQESLVRAWRGLSAFEGRSSLRTWLYRVTTNACLDALDRKSGRVLPPGLSAPAAAGAPIDSPRMEPIWLEPCPADLYQVDSQVRSPEARYEQRESMALAFLVALQLLPPKQRAVLILRDVVGWEASECAELLDLSVAAVNSALQRARETLALKAADARAARRTPDADVAALLARYVEAWEQADVSRLVSLLHEDATLAMPPIPTWLLGAQRIADEVQAMVFAHVGPGAFRLVSTEANGLPALAAYQRNRETGRLEAASLHLVAVRDDRIAALDVFMDPSLFVRFGLPETLPFTG